MTRSADLVNRSAPNSRYIFLVVSVNAGQLSDFADPLQEEIDSVLASMSEEDAAWWSERLLVAGQVHSQMDNWLKDVFSSDVGTYGMGIDRFQRVESDQYPFRTFQHHY